MPSCLCPPCREPQDHIHFRPRPRPLHRFPQFRACPAVFIFVEARTRALALLEAGCGGDHQSEKGGVLMGSELGLVLGEWCRCLEWRMETRTRIQRYWAIGEAILHVSSERWMTGRRRSRVLVLPPKLRCCRRLHLFLALFMMTISRLRAFLPSSIKENLSLIQSIYERYKLAVRCRERTSK